jgi:adenylate cyclase
MAEARTKARGRTGRRRTWKQRAVGVVPGLVVTAIVVVLQLLDLPATHELGNLVFDAYQRAAPRPYQDEPVRVVDIDDESIREIGQWPWPRTDIARLNNAIAKAGAQAIGYDIVFSEADRTSPASLAQILRNNPEAKGDYAEIARLPDHDKVLGKSFGSTPAVPGFFLTLGAGSAPPPQKAGFAFAGTPPASIPAFGGAIDPLAVISKDAPGAGFVSLNPNLSGDTIVRQVLLVGRVGDQTVPALSLETLRVAQGAGSIVVKSSDASGQLGSGKQTTVVAVKTGVLEVPTTNAGELWMYYTDPDPAKSPASQARVIPAWKILKGALSPDQLRQQLEHRIVLVGSGAQGLQDLVSTPVSNAKFPRELGVVVHAQALEQMMAQKFLTRPDWAPGAERSLLLLLGLIMSLALPGLGALRSGIMAGIAFVAAGAVSWFAFKDHGLLLDPTFPALGTVVVYMAATFYSFFSEERARAYIHRAFDRYLSPELVARIARDP